MKQRTNKGHQEQSCEADVAKSGGQMKEDCGHQERKVKRNTEKKHDEFSSFERDILYSKNGERNGHPFRFEEKRVYEAGKRHYSEQSSCYRKRSTGSPRYSSKKSRKQDWDRRDRSRIDYHDNLKKNFSRNDGRSHSPMTNGKHFTHEGKHSGRDWSKIEPRGSKQQRTKLRERLAKQYIPNHYLFGFSNKRNTCDALNSKNTKSEIRRKFDRQRRLPSHNKLLDSNDEEEIQNRGRPCSEHLKSRGTGNKRMKFDRETENKAKRRGAEISLKDKKKSNFERQASCYTSENAMKLKDDHEIAVKSTANGNVEVSRNSLVSKKLKISNNENSKENDETHVKINESLLPKTMEREDDVDNHRMEGNFSEERSAFKFVKQCLLRRPGSSIKHQQELLINYKSSTSFENDKVPQCKHSDAVEIGKEGVNGKCINGKCTDDCRQKVCIDEVLNSKTESFGTLDRNCAIEASVTVESPIKNANSSKKEDSVKNPVVDAVEVGVNADDAGHDDTGEVMLVAEKSPSQSGAKNENRTKNNLKSAFDFDRMDLLPKSIAVYKNEETKNLVFIDRKIDDRDPVGEEMVAGKYSEKTGANLLLPVQQTGATIQQIAENSNDVSPLGEKFSETNSSAISSYTHGSRLETSPSERNSSPIFEKVNCDIVNQSKREFKKMENKMNICDVVSNETIGYVPENKSNTMLTASTEPRMSVKCENTKTSEKLDSSGKKLINNANDSLVAPATAKKTIPSKSFNSTVNHEDVDVRVENIKCLKHKSVAPVAESDERHKYISCKAEMKKNTKSGVSESVLPTSFDEAKDQNKENVTDSFSNSSSKDLVVEWDSKDNGSSLGIRISDVFSLKREEVESEVDGYRSVTEGENGKDESCVEEKEMDLREGKQDHIEQETNFGRAKRYPENNASLKYEDLKKRRPSEHSAAISRRDVENICKKGIEPCEVERDELHHMHEVDNLMEAGREISCSKADKFLNRSVVSVDSAPATADCQHDDLPKRKRKKRKIRAISSPCGAMQTDRILLDLPRHNWLIERLLSEKMLDSDTIEGEKSGVALQEDESKPKNSKRKKKDNQDQIESAKLELSKEAAQAMDIGSLSKSMNSSEENSDSSAESMECMERLPENINKEKIEDKTAKLTDVVDSRNCETNNGNSSRETEFPAFDAAVQNKVSESKSTEATPIAQNSLKISIPNFNLEKREEKSNQLAILSANSGSSDLCTSSNRTSAGASNTDKIYGCKLETDMTLLKNENEQMDSAKRDVEQVISKERRFVSPKCNFEREKDSCNDRMWNRSIDSDKNESKMSEAELVWEEQNKNEEKNEVQKAAILVATEKQCLVSENPDNSTLQNRDKSLRICSDVASVDPAHEIKDGNHYASISVSLQEFATTNARCSRDTLGSGPLAHMQREKIVSEDQRLEVSALQQAPSQKDKKDQNYLLPPFTANSLHHESNKFQNRSTFIHCPSEVPNESKFEVSFPYRLHNPSSSFTSPTQRQNEASPMPIASCVGQSSYDCSSHLIASVVPHKHFSTAVGGPTHESESKPQSYTKKLSCQTLNMEHPVNYNLCTVDTSYNSPSRPEVNNMKYVATSCERYPFSEKNEAKERGLSKASLDEKAEIILSIIEDTSISDSTKQELVDYWRSIRKMTSHSSTDVSDQKSKLSQYTRGEKTISRFDPISVPQNKPPLHASRVASDQSGMIVLGETDNLTRHLAEQVPEHESDCVKHVNGQLHLSAKHYRQGLNPAAEKGSINGMSNSIEMVRSDGFEHAKAIPSELALSNRKIEEMRRKGVERQEVQIVAFVILNIFLCLILLKKLTVYSVSFI